MNGLNRLLAAGLLTVIASTASWATDTAIEGVSGPAEKAFRNQASAVPQIERVIEMDAQKIRVIRSMDGRTMYMVDNGRFVLVGDLFDMWQRKRLKTMDDIAQAVRTMDLKGAGFDLDHANKFTLGTGTDHVTVFVDPQCGWCHKLIDEVAADETLKAEHTFDFVVIPVLGEESERLARRFSCTSQTDPAKRFEAFQKGAEGINALPQKHDCNGAAYFETKQSAKILGIHSAPLVVASDGRFARGKPQSMAAFLKGSMSDGGHDQRFTALKPAVSADQARAVEQSVKAKWKAEAQAASKKTGAE